MFLPLALPEWAAFLSERRRLLTLAVVMRRVNLVVEILEACWQRVRSSDRLVASGVAV